MFIFVFCYWFLFDSDKGILLYKIHKSRKPYLVNLVDLNGLASASPDDTGSKCKILPVTKPVVTVIKPKPIPKKIKRYTKPVYKAKKNKSLDKNSDITQKNIQKYSNRFGEEALLQKVKIYNQDIINKYVDVNVDPTTIPAERYDNHSPYFDGITESISQLSTLYKTFYYYDNNLLQKTVVLINEERFKDRIEVYPREIREDYLKGLKHGGVYNAFLMISVSIADVARAKTQTPNCSEVGDDTLERYKMTKHASNLMDARFKGKLKYKSINNIIKNPDRSVLDTKTGNINQYKYFTEFSKSSYVRVTIPSNGNKTIISIGFDKINGVNNKILNGRYIEFK